MASLLQDGKIGEFCFALKTGEVQLGQIKLTSYWKSTLNRLDSKQLKEMVDTLHSFADNAEMGRHLIANGLFLGAYLGVPQMVAIVLRFTSKSALLDDYTIEHCSVLSILTKGASDCYSINNARMDCRDYTETLDILLTKLGQFCERDEVQTMMNKALRTAVVSGSQLRDGDMRQDFSREIIEELCKKAEIGDEKMGELLHLCCEQCYPEAVQVLLDAGADVTWRYGERNTTALYSLAQSQWAVVNRDRCKTILTILTSRGLNVDDRDSQGESVLHYAIKNNCSVASIFFEPPQVREKPPHATRMARDVSYDDDTEGASFKVSVLQTDSGTEEPPDVNLKDAYGRTALHLAIIENSSTLIRAVLSTMLADPNICDLEGRTAMVLLAKHAKDEEFCMETCHALIEAGARPDDIDMKGKTALHYLAKKPTMTNVVRFLIQLGARVDTTDHRGRTPFHNSAKNANLQQMIVLLTSGANEDETDNDAYTGLHLCMQMHWMDRLLQQDYILALQYLLQRHDAESLFINYRSGKRTSEQCFQYSFDRYKKHSYEEVPLSVLDRLVEQKGDMLKVFLLDQQPDIMPTKSLQGSDKRGPQPWLLSVSYDGEPQRSILLHPVVQLSVDGLWRKRKWGYIFECSMNILFLGLFVFNFCTVTHELQLQNFKTTGSNVTTTSEMQHEPITRWCLMTVWLILLISEVVQMIWWKRKYLLSLENMLDLTMLLLTFVFIVLTQPCYIGWSFGLIGLFLAYMNCMWTCRLIPRLLGVSKVHQIHMVFQMYFKVLKLMLPLLPLLLAVLAFYAIIFGVFFPSLTRISFLMIQPKILSMLIGELNFDDLFMDEEGGLKFGQYSKAMLLLFFLFQLAATIAFTNLAIAWVVGDIVELKAKSYFDYRRAQIDTVINIMLMEAIIDFVREWITTKFWHANHHHSPQGQGNHQDMPLLENGTKKAVVGQRPNLNYLLVSANDLRATMTDCQDVVDAFLERKAESSRNISEVEMAVKQWEYRNY